MLDFNDAEPQRSGDLIPPCYAKLKGVIRPGGVDGYAPGDQGLLKASNSSDAMMLDFEFTVMMGPNANRKLFTNMVVSGGSVDEKGVSKGWKVSKSIMRAMVESALGIRPDDMSPAAVQKRQLPNFAAFSGIEFAALIEVEKGKPKPDGSGNYDDKNVIKTVITPDRAEWQAIMSGQDVPLPAKAGGATGGAPAAGKPAWGGGAATASPPAQAKPAAGPAWGGSGGAQPATQQQAAPAQQQPAKAAGPAWLNG